MFDPILLRYDLTLPGDWKQQVLLLYQGLLDISVKIITKNHVMRMSDVQELAKSDRLLWLQNPQFLALVEFSPLSQEDYSFGSWSHVIFHWLFYIQNQIILFNL